MEFKALHLMGWKSPESLAGSEGGIRPLKSRAGMRRLEPKLSQTPGAAKDIRHTPALGRVGPHPKADDTQVQDFRCRRGSTI